MWTVQSAYAEARAAAEAKTEFIRGRAEHYLHNYMEHLPGLSREEIGRLLAESNQERLAAVPSYDTYPELRGMPEIIEAEWRGTRDGARLDDVQAATYINANFYFHRVIYSGKVKQKAHCSVVYFPTSDHGALFANNLDTDIHEPYGPPEWPLCNEHLIIGGVSSGVYLDEESPEIFPAPVHKLVARYCRTTDEAVEMLTRYNYFWGPGNMIVIDRDQHVAMIEKTSCRIGVRHSPDGFGFITAMTAQDPDIKAYLADRRTVSVAERGLPTPCADTRYWEAQDTRHEIMERLLDEARANPTLEAMRALMQYRGEDGVVCDNGDLLHPDDPPIEFTIKTAIVCLSEGRAQWWTRDNEKEIPSWENKREDIQFENVSLWG